MKRRPTPARKRSKARGNARRFSRAGIVLTQIVRAFFVEGAELQSAFCVACRFSCACRDALVAVALVESPPRSPPRPPAPRPRPPRRPRKAGFSSSLSSSPPPPRVQDLAGERPRERRDPLVGALDGRLGHGAAPLLGEGAAGGAARARSAGEVPSCTTMSSAQHTSAHAPVGRLRQPCGPSRHCRAASPRTPKSPSTPSPPPCRQCGRSPRRPRPPLQVVAVHSLGGSGKEGGLATTPPAATERRVPGPALARWPRRSAR